MVFPWEELDAYDQTVEEVVGPSGERYRLSTTVFWDMEDWASEMYVIVKAAPTRGWRRYWPFKAVEVRGGPNDLVPRNPSGSFRIKCPTPRADYAGVGRWDARLLILVNATAAASSFVASLLVADRSWNPLPILTVAVGLIGCGYFTSRAEGIRRSMHASDSADD